MNYRELPEFLKELKKLSKKYLSLIEDLDELKKVINEMPLGTGRHFNVLISTEKVKIVKGRLFCRYLKGSSLRIIYSYYEELKTIEFLEIYFKGDKPNEDKERIKDYLKSSS